jgi:hypothetical protein
MDRVRAVRVSEGVLIAFGLIAFVRRRAAPNDPAPAWLLGLAVLAGIAWVAIPWTTEVNHRVRVSLTSIVAFLLIIVMKRAVFLLLIGSALGITGILGVVCGQIAVRGRSGPARVYSGRTAYAWAAVFIVVGAAAALLALVPWPTAP